MRLVFWAGFWAFITDQASKYAVVHLLNLREVIAMDVLPPLLRFHMAWNDGINFGLFSGSPEIARWFLIAIAVAISVFVLVWIKRDPPGKWQHADRLHERKPDHRSRWKRQDRLERDQRGHR